jgi:rubredoxin
MSDKIIPCPSCKTLLLGTAKVCPRCGHAFEPRAPEPESVQKPEAVTGDDILCPACDELVPKGLIRCWNCGNFLQTKLP